MAFLEAGDEALAHAARLLTTPAPSALHAVEGVRLCAPVPPPGKIIAVGLNYRDHSLEQGIEPPVAPCSLPSFPPALPVLIDPIVIPSGDPQVDYEVELAVVIGRRGKAISEGKAMDFLTGYTVLNDVSARRWQFADKQWVRGKSSDSFCPTGPWVPTRDEVGDPHELRVTTRVNGVRLQDSNTRKPIFRIPQLIAYISASITLEPGDIIATGTPEGVGVIRQPPVFLKHGDIVETEIQDLGVLHNPFKMLPPEEEPVPPIFFL